MSVRGSTLAIKTEIEFFIEECCNCHVLFAVTTDMHNDLVRDKHSFYCPSGHPQSYMGKTHAQLLREAKESAAAESRRAAEAEARLRAERAERKRAEKRVANGVCPCCKRSFVQLTRHMRSKHPEYVEQKP